MAHPIPEVLVVDARRRLSRVSISRLGVARVADLDAVLLWAASHLPAFEGIAWKAVVADETVLCAATTLIDRLDAVTLHLVVSSVCAMAVTEVRYYDLVAVVSGMILH
jgi:hypothetical protein